MQEQNSKYIKQIKLKIRRKITRINSEPYLLKCEKDVLIEEEIHEERVSQVGPSPMHEQQIPQISELAKAIVT